MRAENFLPLKLFYKVAQSARVSCTDCLKMTQDDNVLSFYLFLKKCFEVPSLFVLRKTSWTYCVFGLYSGEVS